jgi:hypothetical protein
MNRHVALSTIEKKFSTMATSMVNQDVNRHSVSVLLIALERRDRENLPVCTRCVLKSVYDHLRHEYLHWPNASGEAMCTLLVLGSESGIGG